MFIGIDPEGHIVFAVIMNSMVCNITDIVNNWNEAICLVFPDKGFVMAAN